MIKKQIFLLAGEPSGDLHASNLVKALKNQGADYHFMGVAGPSMRAEGIESVMNMEKFTVMGFSDVLKNFPSLYKQFYSLRDSILKTQPQAVIFVDYPGLNLRMAKALRKEGYKGQLIHYICPSVWAWGKKRIDHMVDTLDLLMTIYPFEASCFSHTSLKVNYIGNPLQEYIEKHTYCENWGEEFNYRNHPFVAIFPGSRQGEIHLNLPKQLEAAALFQANHPEIAFGISCSNPALKPLVEKIIQKYPVKKIFIVPRKYTYEMMRDCESAIAKSGTVTLELALHQKPTVVVYGLSFLNWFIAKFFIRPNLPHYCIVNILSKKRLFPELIAEGFEAKNLAQALENIHSGSLREECLKGCAEIKALFKDTASYNAAQAVKELLL